MVNALLVTIRLGKLFFPFFVLLLSQVLPGSMVVRLVFEKIRNALDIFGLKSMKACRQSKRNAPERSGK